MIRVERYGGGTRWYCIKCDVRDYTITWTNSTPPRYCVKCETPADVVDMAIQFIKNRYEHQAIFPGSIRAIAYLCQKHGLVPVGITKTAFARLINERTPC